MRRKSTATGSSARGAMDGDEEESGSLLQRESSSSGTTTADTSRSRSRRDKRQQVAKSVLYTLLLLACLSFDMPERFSWGPSPHRQTSLTLAYPPTVQETNDDHPKQNQWTYPDVVYGHIHMAKTAGSEINGELASHFERVCGNKGSSYDFYQANLRFQASGATNAKWDANDLIYKVTSKHNRAKVPADIMEEAGFEDCDFISREVRWQRWQKLLNDQPIMAPMELHLPCRDPVNHLMSMCNHRGRKFDCEATDLLAEIKKCDVLTSSRFSKELTQLENTTVKCFNPIPIDPYINYMSEHLQRRRIEATYVHRDTNRPRNKTQECIWNHPKFEEVKGLLLQNYDYYGFCDECMGSEAQLPF